MRTPLACALSAALLLSFGCSKDKASDAAPAAAASGETATAAAPAGEKIFTPPELESMLAPLALHADPLLAQVLMASTYPGDVADAAAWSKANPKASGDEAVRQVADQPWDPSVQSLVAFPQMLSLLGQDPGWVQSLGDAVLAQPDDVMDAIQRLRHKAQEKGSLATNEFQEVTTQPAAVAGEPETIVVESSNPEEVYVPAYDTNEVYGEWEDSSYPPASYPPDPGYYPGQALATGLRWGAGILVADALWGDVDWDDDDFDIDVDNYNNINVNNIDSDNWNHNSVNRDGVPYRGEVNRQKYGNQIDGAAGRQAYRGDDAARAKQREQARSSMGARSEAATRERGGQDRAGQDRGGQRDAGRDQQRDQARDSGRDRGGDTADRGGGDRQQQRTQDRPRQQTQTNTAARDGARQQQRTQQAPRNDAFAGASRPSSSTRTEQQRGGESRQRSTSGGSGGSRSSGQQVNRSAPERGGRGR